jgi:hypothetical protein
MTHFHHLISITCSLVIEQIEEKSKKSKIIFSSSDDEMIYNLSEEMIIINSPTEVKVLENQNKK